MNKTNLKALIGVLQKENQGLKEELELEKGGREHDVQQFQEVLSENQGLKTKIEEFEDRSGMAACLSENKDLRAKVSILTTASQTIETENDELKAKIEKLEDFSHWENHPALKYKVVLDEDYYMEHAHSDHDGLIHPDYVFDLEKQVEELKEEIKELKAENENLRRRPHPEYVKELETKVEKLKEEKKKVEKDELFYRLASIGADEVVQKLKKENADLLLAIGSKVVSEIINKVEKEDEKSTELENLMEYKNSYEEHQHMLAFIAGNYKNGTYVEAILCKYYDKEFIENSEEVWESFGLFTDVEGGGWEKYWETPNECLNTVPDERLVPIANGELTRLQDEVKELTTYKKEVTDSIQQAVARVLDLEGFY